MPLLLSGANVPWKFSGQGNLTVGADYSKDICQTSSIVDCIYLLRIRHHKYAGNGVGQYVIMLGVHHPRKKKRFSSNGTNANVF